MSSVEGTQPELNEAMQSEYSGREKKVSDEILEIKTLAAKKSRQIAKENGLDVQETFNDLLRRAGYPDLISEDPETDKKDFLLTPFEKEYIGESAIQDLATNNFDDESESTEELEDKVA